VYNLGISDFNSLDVPLDVSSYAKTQPRAVLLSQRRLQITAPINRRF
jgi:hypothetical protein